MQVPPSSSASVRRGPWAQTTSSFSVWHQARPTYSERRTTVVGIIFKLALPDRGTTRGCECDWCHRTILRCRIKKGWFSFSDSEHTEGGLVEVFRTGYSCFCYFLLGSEKMDCTVAYQNKGPCAGRMYYHRHCCSSVGCMVRNECAEQSALCAVTSSGP